MHKNRSQNYKHMMLGGFLLVILSSLARYFSPIPNVSPMESLALASGAYIILRSLAFAIPFITWYLTDLVINNTVARQFFTDHEGMVWFSDYMIANFIAMLAIVMIGRILIKKVNIQNVLLGTVTATLVFFLISNGGVWLTSNTVPKTFSGLLTVLGAGLPFLKSSFAGNLLFSAILFGGYELLSKWIPQLKLSFETNSQATFNEVK